MASNILTYTEDWSNPIWSQADGLTITTDTHAAPAFAGLYAGRADTLTDPTAVTVSSSGQLHGVADDASAWQTSIYIRKDADTTRFPAFQLSFVGGTTVNAFLAINTSTGVTGAITGLPTPDISQTLDIDSLWWRVMMQKSNNATGNTDATVTIYPALSDVFGNSFTSAVLGSVIVWGANLVNEALPGHAYEPNPFYPFSNTLTWFPQVRAQHGRRTVVPSGMLN